MIVDTFNYQIKFINSAKPTKEFKYKLEKQHWKDKKLYVYVTMIYKGDCVSIMDGW